MAVGKIGQPIDIAVAGMQAESMKLKVIAKNIANARTTRTEAGGPYRRQMVVMADADDGQRVPQVVPDVSTAFKSVYMPGHPDAGKDGMVLMPNVDLPTELIDMIVASRAYQANAAMMKRYEDMVNVSLELLR